MRRKQRWEYCECGCKSFVAVVKGKPLRIFWDLKDGYWLSYHHPFGPAPAKYPSMKAAEKAASEML